MNSATIYVHPSSLFVTANLM